MDKINFRYTKEIDVQLVKRCDKVEIIFSKNNKPYVKYFFNPYLDSILFNYNIFDSMFGIFGYNKVKCTSKYGTAFIASCSYFNKWYAIRSKKNKDQIIVLESNERLKHYTLKDNLSDIVCYVNGELIHDEKLVNDFFQARPIKNMTEEEYIESLDEDDRKIYLDDKKIDSVIQSIGFRNKLSDDQIHNISLYICCLSDDDPLKIKVLESTNGVEIEKEIISLEEKAKESNNVEYNYKKTEDREYKVTEDFIYNEYNFDDYEFYLKSNEQYVYDLFYTFLEKYEMKKEDHINAIERVMKTIDEIVPIFKEYITSRTNNQ